MKKGDKDDDDDEADAKASSRPLAEARGEEYKADAKASDSDVACGGSKAEALPAMRAMRKSSAAAGIRPWLATPHVRLA